MIPKKTYTLNLTNPVEALRNECFFIARKKEVSAVAYISAESVAIHGFGNYFSK